VRIVFVLVIFTGCFRLPSPVTPIGESIVDVSSIVQSEKDRFLRHLDIRSFYTCYVSSRYGTSEIRQVVLLRKDGSVRLETFPPQLIPHSLALFISKPGTESVLLVQTEKRAVTVAEGATPIGSEITIPLPPQHFLGLLLGFVPNGQYTGYKLENKEQLVAVSGLEVIRDNGRIVEFNLRDDGDIIVVKGKLSDFDIVPRKVSISVLDSGTNLECKNQLIETHENLSDKPFEVSVPKGWR
jgi:hypothetical protein